MPHAYAAFAAFPGGRECDTAQGLFAILFHWRHRRVGCFPFWRSVGERGLMGKDMIRGLDVGVIIVARGGREDDGRLGSDGSDMTFGT